MSTNECWTTICEHCHKDGYCTFGDGKGYCAARDLGGLEDDTEWDEERGKYR